MLRLERDIERAASRVKLGPSRALRRAVGPRL
jgi:hypothetical protein